MYRDLFVLGAGNLRGALNYSYETGGLFRDVARASITQTPLLRRVRGKRVADVMTVWPGPPILTSSVFTLFEQQGFTGYRKVPFQEAGGSHLDVTACWLLGASGRAGALDEGRQVHALLPATAHTNPVEVKRGFFYVDDLWDGSDFVCPDGTGAIHVTRRVIEALTAAGVKNWTATPLVDFELL